MASPVVTRQEYDETLGHRFQRAATMQAGLVILIPIVVLIGWQFNLEYLKRVAPTLVAMNPLTALGFVILGIALLLLQDSSNELKKLLVFLCVAVVTTVGALVLIRYLWNLPFYPDRWVFTDRLDVAGQKPNVMAPNTALCFLLGSLSLMATSLKHRLGRYATEFLAVIISFLAIFALFGYFYQNQVFTTVQAFIPMAANTSLCFLLLGMAILFSRPNGGLMSLVSSGQGAGYLLRRLIPMTVLAPGILGWVLIAGQEADLYSAKVGVALFAAAIALFGSVLVYISGKALYRKELEVERIKDEFLSLATHQLQTPSTGVKMALSLLRDGAAGKLSRSQAALVKDAIEGNNREIKIVGDLLNVARADSGRMVLKKSPTDMRQLIQNIVREQQATIDSREQKLTIKIHDVVANVDASRLSMAVENLLSNASKYTPDGGTLAIETLQTHDNLILKVTDNGVGIPKDSIPKLFSKFVRLDNPLSGKRGGTGLGLYLAKQIVELHGGTIRVQSETGKGSQFIIELPVGELHE